MAKSKEEVQTNEDVIVRAKDFWTRYQKPIITISAVIILLAGGYLAYKYLIVSPKEEKAQDALYKSEEYFRMDSMRLALNGDGTALNPGLLKVIDNYGGTESGNLARYYAGVALIRTGDFQKAVGHLEKFDSDNKQTQARAYKLLGDAYAELGNNDKAISFYEKSAEHFPEDQANSSEALFFAASLSEKSGKTKQAIEYYRELKEKYPLLWGDEAEKYLARLGVYE